ncbi:MAG: ParB/RepB/Spo0J family partition protein [Candidatus Auribacterota bacterium]|nr:ParB/RepB/Spo0J family partition protein [Candidatus Auribacterota bacterium]
MEIKRIRVSKIISSLCKMRLEKDYEEEEMRESISDRGVMNPVKLKPVEGGYRIFAGHRRLKGAKDLGKKMIIAEVRDDVEDKEAVLMGFVENINRKDFTRLEEGYAYRKLVEDYGYSVDNLIKPCGKSRSRIYTLLNLVKHLTPAMKEAIIAGKMTSGHGEWLLRIEDPKRRKKCFELVLAGEMDLADLKYEVYRQTPDEEKNDRELQLDIIEDICEEDATIRSMWKKSITARRSRTGLKITIDIDGPHDLLYKFNTITEPVKKKLDLFDKFNEKY